MNDQAQYANMMNQLNAINTQGKELLNEKREDQQEKLNEYKKTLEMTTEGIGGGILHDTGMNLIKSGLKSLKDKIPIPTDELEKMVQDYKKGGAKKMFEGMTKRGYSKAKTKIFGDETDGEDGETAVKKVFGKLFKRGKAQTPSTISTNIQDNLPLTQDEIDKLPPPSDDFLPEPEITEPDFDNIGSKKEFKAQNKLLKDKVKSLDPDTQQKIQKDLNNDSTIKKPSELKAITDPEEKLTEQTKRSKALNDRVNEEINKQPLPPPPSEEETLAGKAKTTLSRLQPLEDDTQKEEDTATSGKGFLSRLFGKKTTIDPSLVDNEEDSGLLQRPRQLKGKIVQGLGGLAEDEEEGGGLLSGIDKIAQAGVLGSQLFKKGETGKQREQLLGSTAKQTILDNVKDQTTGAVSDAIQGNEDSDNLITSGLKAVAQSGEKDLLDDSLKSTAEKAGTRLATTDAELGGPEDPFGDVISGLVGLGTLLGGIFGAKKKHLPPAPAYVPINPSFQSGA